MRLTDHERQAIRAAVAGHFGPGARVRLFGSRRNDSAAGGDIDLFIDNCALTAREMVRRRIDLRVELCDRLGDQRIDIVVQREDGPILSIHRHARETGILL